MDKKFLERYKEKEKRETRKFLNDFKRGKFKAEDRYPPQSRLRLNEPYTHSIPFEPIWPLIPFYGTTIIGLNPIAEKMKFERSHGFNIGDIPRLVELAKDTQKVQFSVFGDPTKFEGINFLEQIFDELEPPVEASILPDINQDDVKEFQILSNYYGFSKACNEIFAAHGIKAEPWYVSVDYAVLKYLGFHELADDIKSSIINKQYGQALKIIRTAKFLLGPYLDPLKPILSIRRGITELKEEFLKRFNMQPAKFEFPYEVGRFLNDKLTLIVPKDIEGAIKVSEVYDLSELRKVMNALNESIKREAAASLIKESREISMIFEDVWAKTDRLREKEKFIQKYGVSVGIAAIGSIATLPLSSFTGLLAGLGFTVADKFLEEKVSQAISKKVLNWTTPSHMIHVYDFKKKYGLFK